MVATEDIYVTLGSPWVLPDIIDEFIVYLLGDSLKHCHNYHAKMELLESYKTRHDAVTGTREIPAKARYHHNVATTRTWGTDRMEALHILEKTLNMKAGVITDEIRCLTNASGMKRIINAEQMRKMEMLGAQT
jgi:N12 class adenine-specific DNA methylase